MAHDTSSSSASDHQDSGHHDHDHDHDHHELNFWQKYIFSSDHKIIGIQYGIISLLFLFLGFVLISCMRWQLAYPGQPLPILGNLINDLYGGENGVMTPEIYNMFGAMHGNIMVFLAIVPLGFAAFGNYVVPLQIGAPDMAFPRLNMASFWAFFVGAILIFGSMFIPGGPAQAGWTSYSPLASSVPTNGQAYWLVGLVILVASSLLGAVNFIATIIQLRAPGMTWMKMPFFCWVQFVTAFLLLLAFPPLQVAGLMQLFDIVFDTSFFLPSGLIVGGQPADIAGGGSPILWQHLFWFLAHPEVYVLILPAIGMVCEIISNNTRRPLWGYKTLVYAVLTLGFLSFIVWAHHMYLTGMGTVISTFFQTTTMIISIPSVIILTCIFLSLWGGSIRINTPMLFALAFLPMFGIGGLTGLPLGFSYSDLYLHDTYYVIAHFHYIVAPGTIFAFFAGIYYWYPKATGRYMSDYWGRVHFWLSLLFMNMIFMPMFLQGLNGMHRRMYDGGATYIGTNSPEEGVVGVLTKYIELNQTISIAAWCLGLAQIPFIVNFFYSISKGKKVNSDNPWKATTLEWQTPTPPPHGNFVEPIQVYRGPYEYSSPHDDDDFLPQNAKPADSDADKKESTKETK